jgi:hypothetical protein
VVIYAAHGGAIMRNTILSTPGGESSIEIIKVNDGITIAN